jgi:sigma-B regulation protein RsbU (phosphoserine phosphatase)
MLRASPFSFFIKSLGRRVTVLTLLPVTVFLATAGFLGFLSAKEVMLAEWREGAIARLQRAAHHINMRLNRPMEWIEMFHTTSGERGSPLIQEWIIKQLGKLEGVEEVQVDWSVSPETENETRGPGRMWSRGQGHAGMGGDESRRFNKGRISEVTAPRYDAQKGKETVSLLSELKDESGKV